MSVAPRPMQNFNLDTMSGVYPGSRTRVYQRLRVQFAPEGHPQAEPIWAQLQWYADPAAAALLPMRHPQADTPVQLYLPDPQREDFLPRLQSAAADQGLSLTACFTCRYWRATGHRNEDGIPLGRCGWTGQPNHAAPPLPDVLAGQSALSLACSHHSPTATPNLVPSAATAQPTPRVPKAAELDPDRLPFWPRLLHRARSRFHPHPVTPPDWTAQLVERSGVGAGTEPCFVCQGRLANLGALAVASPEGDKQTFSVWRCRICHTTYLNDWIDRWERLESLETEERYYRIAPAEAFAALRIIHAETGGEHPAQRARRGHLRAQLLDLIGPQPPLSHQIRQGR